MQTLEIPRKKATIIGGKRAAGGIALLLKIGGVAFSSVNQIRLGMYWRLRIVRQSFYFEEEDMIARSEIV